MSSVTLQIRIHARPEEAIRVRQILLALAAPTRSQANCISYSLHCSSDTTGLFLFHTGWVHRRALDEYLKGSQIGELQKELNGLLADPIAIGRWERIR